MSDTKIKWNVEQNYNDTVSSMVATLCLRAYEIYDKEVLNPWIDQRTAIARAIGDSIKEHISIVQIQCSIDRSVPSDVLKNPDFIEHELKRSFMLMADEIYKSDNWRVQKRGFPVHDRFLFEVGILKLKPVKE